MMKAIGALAVCLFLVSCASVEKGVSDMLMEMVNQGVITQAQFEEFMAVYREGAAQGTDWLTRIGEIGLGIIGAWLGVPWVANLSRGKINARKGVAPTPTTEALAATIGAAAAAAATGVSSHRAEPAPSTAAATAA